MWHAQTAPLRAKTFLEHPHIHTCFLSPAALAGTARCGGTGRQSSVSAFPIEENLSIGSHCSRWYVGVSPRLCFCYLPKGGGGEQVVFFSHYTLKGVVVEGGFPKQSLSSDIPETLHNNSVMLTMFWVACILTARLVTENVHVLTEITTSAPVMVSTDAPKMTVTVSVKNAEWITTITVPPIIAETGEINPATHNSDVSLLSWRWCRTETI